MHFISNMFSFHDCVCPFVVIDVWCSIYLGLMVNKNTILAEWISRR